MIVAFGVIGVLILLLIYFVLRAQNLQKELILSRSSNKQSNSKVNYAQRNLVLVTDALEKNLTQRLQSLYKSRLINQDQYDALLPLMTFFSTIVMNCCEKGDSLEESLKKALANEEITLEGIQLTIRELPSNLRMLWSKNTADGFIAFCQAVTSVNSTSDSQDSAQAKKAS
ncbi:hypothetical protein ACOJR9_00295 [Alteromonas sp. A081]|uniref:hypothetical protein n=1 Tax=Alteromonas sp. A081 TaxID=3410269 RepID=UPI003B980B73